MVEKMGKMKQNKDFSKSANCDPTDLTGEKNTKKKKKKRTSTDLEADNEQIGTSYPPLKYGKSSEAVDKLIEKDDTKAEDIIDESETRRAKKKKKKDERKDKHDDCDSEIKIEPVLVKEEFSPLTLDEGKTEKKAKKRKFKNREKDNKMDVSENDVFDVKVSGNDDDSSKMVNRKGKSDIYDVKAESDNETPAKVKPEESIDDNDGESQTEKKKQKKMKKKKKKDKRSESGEVKEDEAKMSKKGLHALEYLQTWKMDQKNWKFQKCAQVWLLQNMYDETKVSDDDFVTLQEYLQDLAGASKLKTVQEAEKILEGENTPEKQEERAKNILQLLS